jgi:hypothetical protein
MSDIVLMGKPYAEGEPFFFREDIGVASCGGFFSSVLRSTGSISIRLVRIFQSLMLSSSANCCFAASRARSMLAAERMNIERWQQRKSLSFLEFHS